MFDRNTVIGIILIFVIFVGWSYFFSPKPAPVQPKSSTTDTVSSPIQRPDTTAVAVAKPSLPFIDSLASTTDSIPLRQVKVETNQFSAVLTGQGGGIEKLALKHYHYVDNGDVEMLAPGSAPIPTIMSNVSGFADTELRFATLDSDVELKTAGASQTITFSALIPGRGEITKQFTFYADRYDFDFTLKINGVQQLGLDREYVVAWLPGIPPTEKNLSNDYSGYKGGAHVGGEMRKLDDFENGRLVADISGTTSWVGSRTKYFAFMIAPKSGSGEGAYLRGAERTRMIDNESIKEREISAGLVMASGVNTSIEKTFTIFAGPLDYTILKHYQLDLEDFIDWGWIIIKPFSHAIYWLTYQLHKFVPNYGAVIILVAILLKIITFPLTRKSLKSMTAMRNLGPKMEELKVKYKSDPQKLNQSIMKLYKEEGVNPFGGCLLLLPQMPLMYGLYSVFNSTIEFRQAYFMSIWPDLSIPDPFPYVMPIVMTIAMFLQQKMSITDPKQKMMVYLMPVIFFFVMKSMPVGLVLYWTVYSVLSIGEQLIIKRNDAPLNPQVK